MPNLFQYYGVDLLGMAMILSSIYSIGNKKRYGFILGIFGNLSYLTFAALTHSIPTMFTNVILVTLNVRGYIKWKATEE